MSQTFKLQQGHVESERAFLRARMDRLQREVHNFGPSNVFTTVTTAVAMES
jgi:hypothetical protein